MRDRSFSCPASKMAASVARCKAGFVSITSYSLTATAATSLAGLAAGGGFQGARVYA